MDEIQALLSGLKLGNNSPISKLALAGMNPSSGMPRGAPPPADPLVGQFKQAILQLNGLAQALARQGDQSRSIDIQEYSLKLQRMSVDRQNDIAKAGTPTQESGEGMNANFPNINGGGTI